MFDKASVVITNVKVQTIYFQNLPKTPLPNDVGSTIVLSDDVTFEQKVNRFRIFIYINMVILLFIKIINSYDLDYRQLRHLILNNELVANFCIICEL